MVVLRCTQKLLARLKQSGDLPAIQSTTRLGDGYGNILRIGARQHLLFISERSRLSVIVPLREAKRLGTVFPDAVCDRSRSSAFPPRTSPRTRTDVGNGFRPDQESQLLGTMNDFALMAQSVDRSRAAPETPEKLMRFLANTPVLPLKGARPIDLTLAPSGRGSGGCEMFTIVTCSLLMNMR